MVALDGNLSGSGARLTRGLILDAAERLFALRGVDGVSLRQIGAAAGSSNHAAVQYHFGDKDQLVRAIFERRLPSLELRRAQLLAEAKREGLLNDTRALMEVMLRPFAEERDADGRFSYAAFTLGLYNQDAMDLRFDAQHLTPLSAHVADLLYSSNTVVPPEIARERLPGIFVMFLYVLQNFPVRGRRRDTVAIPLEEVIVDTLDIATAAYLAPTQIR